MAKISVISDNIELSSIDTIDLSSPIPQPKTIKKFITIKEDRKQNIDLASNSGWIGFQAHKTLSQRLDSEPNQQIVEEQRGSNNPGNQNLPNIVNHGPERDDFALETEKVTHEEAARRRLEKLITTVFDESSDFSWLELFLYTISITLFGFVLTLPLDFIPLHNVIQHPEYWYELLLIGTFNASVGAVSLCITCSYLLNIRFIRNWKNIAFVVGCGILAMIFIVLFTYVLWTLILGYQYPIPFLGIIISYFTLNVLTITVWFLFPVEWRQQPELQARMKFYFLFVQFMFLIPVIVNIIVGLLMKIKNQWQPFVALLLPLSREIVLRINKIIVTKCANGDPVEANVFLKYHVLTIYTTTTSFVIGSHATIVSSWVLMGFGFYKDMKMCLKIVWMKMKNNGTIQDQVNELQNLALNEIIEFHASLSFLFVVLVACHSPNAHLVGNIKNSYWKYEEIEDINKTMLGMGVFFLVDFSTGVICSLILWFTCKINFWKVFLELQKEYAVGLCVKLGRVTTIVSKI